MCVLKCVCLTGRWVISGRTPTGYSEHQVPDVSKHCLMRSLPQSHLRLLASTSSVGRSETCQLPLSCQELSKMIPGPHPQCLKSVLAFWIYSFPGRHEGLCLHCHPIGIWWNWQYGPSGSISTRKCEVLHQEGIRGIYYSIYYVACI